jgi:hypothetical protein
MNVEHMPARWSFEWLKGAGWVVDKRKSTLVHHEKIQTDNYQPRVAAISFNKKQEFFWHPRWQRCIEESRGGKACHLNIGGDAGAKKDRVEGSSCDKARLSEPVGTEIDAERLMRKEVERIDNPVEDGQRIERGEPDNKYCNVRSVWH